MLTEMFARIENFSFTASNFDDAKTKLNTLRIKNPSVVRDFD